MIRQFRCSLFLALAAVMISSCGRSSPEGEKHAGEPAKSEEKHLPEGVVELSTEEVESSGIQVTAVHKGSMTATITVEGIVVAPSGSNATVFSAFPGHLIAPPEGLT